MDGRTRELVAPRVAGLTAEAGVLRRGISDIPRILASPGRGPNQPTNPPTWYPYQARVPLIDASRATQGPRGKKKASSGNSVSLSECVTSARVGSTDSGLARPARDSEF
jgi:hypothetical protein